MSATVSAPAMDADRDEPLWTIQAIIGILTMIIVAATVAAVFKWGNETTIAQMVGSIMTFGGTVLGFYFASSKAAQTTSARQADTLSTIATAAAGSPGAAPKDLIDALKANTAATVGSSDAAKANTDATDNATRATDANTDASNNPPPKPAT